MSKSPRTIAEQLAHTIRDFQIARTGHAPKAVTVVISESTLVFTLQDALTPAEMSLSESPEGAAQVREFHRALFQSSLTSLKSEIERIAGVSVCEADTEVEVETGAVVHVLKSGTVVQVFQLAGGLASEWMDGGNRSKSADGHRIEVRFDSEQPESD